MLSRMAPSSPLPMRTFHLLKTPDILCANDISPEGSYFAVNRIAADCTLLLNFERIREAGPKIGANSRGQKPVTQAEATQNPGAKQSSLRAAFPLW